MNDTTLNEWKVPGEVERMPTHGKTGRPNKVETVIQLGGEKMVSDLASRKEGLKATALRVSDWGNANHFPICYATGRRVVLRLVKDGKLEFREERRNFCVWKIVGFPGQALGPLM